MGMRFVVRRDCDLFIETDDALSLNAFVFLMMTWQRPVFGPTVVARWIDILRAIVPSEQVSTLLWSRDPNIRQTWLAEDLPHGLDR